MDARSAVPLVLVCVRCKRPVEDAGTELRCIGCVLTFPREAGIVDFSGGVYFDHFPGPEVLTPANRRGLANENESARIDDFYRPLLDAIAVDRGLAPSALRVLDSGCGNGESVDALDKAGFDAWGHDLSALRKWQWRERRRRDRLVVADGAALPFPDAAFDAVIASGVLEHVGVREEGGARYRVEPRPDRDDQRLAYLAELLRVLAPGGRLMLDFPNGGFPIDFWHGVDPGGARFHSPSEGFLPTVSEVRTLGARLGVASLAFLSPRGRLRFRQVSFHWYGRAFRKPMAALQRWMSVPAFRFLAASPLNPYLVIEMRRAGPPSETAGRTA